MATFNEIYDQVPGDEQISDETTTTEPPSGYKPLSTKQRTDWNNFTRFLKDKKIGDDKEAGLKYLDEYKKDNPGFSISKETIPAVQYEFQQLKNNGSLPGIESDGRVKSMFNGYMDNRQVSPVDGWIGDITAKQGYPEISEFENDPEKKYWGTDYAGASKFDKGNGNNFAASETETSSNANDNKTSAEKTPLKKNDAAIQTFERSYIQSPKYKERLSKFYEYPEYIQRQRDKIVNDISIRENPTGSSVYYSNDNEAAISEPQGKRYGATRDEVVAHEMAHATNASDENPANRLSKNEEEFIFNRNKSVTPEMKETYLKSSNDKKERLSNLLTGESHDLSPSESKSDIDAFRYLLNKRGIYNAGKSDISKEVLEKAQKDPVIKKSFILKRLKENFDDKAIIEIMNKIAKNNNNQKEELLNEEIA